MFAEADDTRTRSGRTYKTIANEAHELASALRPTATAGCKGPGGEESRQGGPTLQTAASVFLSTAGAGSGSSELLLTSAPNADSSEMEPQLPGLLWPTPDAAVMNDGQDVESYNRRRRRLQEKHRNGNGAGLVLAQAARIWPTPRSSVADNGNDTGSAQRLKQGLNPGIKTAAIFWATATATDAKASGAAYPATETRAAGVTLTDQACRGLLAPLTEPGGTPTSTGGLRLSPLFVEALMGFPIAFTDCDFSVTPSSLLRRRSRGASSGSATRRGRARRSDSTQGGRR